MAITHDELLVSIIEAITPEGALSYSTDKMTDLELIYMGSACFHVGLFYENTLVQVVLLGASIAAEAEIGDPAGLEEMKKFIIKHGSKQDRMV